MPELPDWLIRGIAASIIGLGAYFVDKWKKSKGW